MKKFIVLLSLALAMLALVSCEGLKDFFSDKNGGGNGGSNNDGGIEEITVSFVVTEEDAVIYGEDEVVFEKGSRLKQNKVPKVALDGHLLAGWAYDADGERMWDPINDLFEEDTTLYAIWQKDDGSLPAPSGMVEIVFDLQGGSCINGSNNAYVEIGTSLSLDDVPKVTREGYAFVCWSYNSDGSNPWSESHSITENTVLYAIWESAQNNVTVVFRGNGSGVEFEGDARVEIKVGESLSAAQAPCVYRKGYEFVCWSYSHSVIDPWSEEDAFSEDTVLYAIWSSSENEDGEGTGSSSGGTLDSVPDGGDNQDKPEDGGEIPDPVVPKDPIDIKLNAGTGFYGDDSYCIIQIERGGRLGYLPTPFNDNPAMLFQGWYKDDLCTEPVLRVEKYYENTEIYAKWFLQSSCTDGSFEHAYSYWDTDTLPTCAKNGTVARYCIYCNAKQTIVGDPAKGHLWGKWKEAFMAKERTCTRCGEKDTQSYKNVTLDLLGSVPENQIDGNSGAFFATPLTNLVNGIWDEGYGEFVGPNGTDTAYVIFTFLEPTAIDRIYFKGDGTVNISIYVQYEGESHYTLVGLCAGVSDVENTPYRVTDSTKKIVKVKIQEDNPRAGQSMWQEVAFVRLEGEAVEKPPVEEDEETPPDSDKITVVFDTDTGYFNLSSQYEVEISAGERVTALPTPLHHNPAMLFDGWYRDPDCTVTVSRSDKYYGNTVLYAKWIEQIECTDGTYNHLFSSWDVDVLPTCTASGTYARYCHYCNAKEVMAGESEKGHVWSQWQEAFMSRERVCTRLGCGVSEHQSFKDITLEALGNSPAEQISGNTNAFYSVPFTALINGEWNESYGKYVAPNGYPQAYITFELLEPTALDRIYFKGDGTANVGIYVQYEGEDEYTFIGFCPGVSEREDTPYREPDASKKIVKVKIQEDNPQNGESMWQEVVFCKITEE